jgi:hypothetical protein
VASQAIPISGEVTSTGDAAVSRIISVSGVVASSFLAQHESQQFDQTDEEAPES